MSNNNKSNNIEPKFDEYRAYEELRMIFVIAIETQNFDNIEARIAAWESKYPLADFIDPEIVRKIRTILSKDFLSQLIGDYLAAKILHEEQKQKEAYDALKEIIDSAKKSKNYKDAEKKIRTWKTNLSDKGLSLYSFNRLYRAKICTLLLVPSKELKKQDEAIDELKQIKERGASLDSQTYYEAINNWQNSYSISDFPKSLQEDLNKITAEVFDSISVKRNSESAIKEIEEAISSKDTSSKADAIASILSKYDYRKFDANTMSHIQDLTAQAMSINDSNLENSVSNNSLVQIGAIAPTESKALTDLKDIVNTTPHDMDRILNWIYVNRKINYSQTARDKIVKELSSVGYKVPTQASYSIPEINAVLDYQDFPQIDKIRQAVILNYLGIISQGNNLSITEKDKIIKAHTTSKEENFISQEKPIMFLPVYDTIVEKSEEEPLNEDSKVSENQEEDMIYNIFIEDIIDDPLATYNFTTASLDKGENLPDSKILVPEESIQENEVLKPSVPEEPNLSYESTFNESKPLSKDDSNESSEPELLDNVNEEHILEQKDEENLEQAYNLSTYVVVASPILQLALSQRRKTKSKGFEREKNSEF